MKHDPLKIENLKYLSFGFKIPMGMELKYTDIKVPTLDFNYQD